ncbi:cyclic-di-AMP-binding protein CbpB [Loigolactobacillus rennini]|uniref:CBS domain-containing protein n=2 Tax=Loigolactobacillus rennini TaxID=238013 RepID=A0A0R2CV44_9LACO|nr:cyclic-di-AMP-binding protein CbpB [Loigolactobacillus rennini]KRM95711.1 CBS domain-containing protein [Loigolactobacillus rennini DSM 20253]SFZ88363.1 Inosine-5'-monophosphate dehydrogenase [Loigolactobacillus rennini]
MISQPILNGLLQNKAHFLIPAEKVANVQVDNNLNHAFLMLTKIHYARIPVLANDSKFVGLISLAMITEAMMGKDDFDLNRINALTVGDVCERDVPTVENPYDIELILHLLVDNPFLPVVSSEGDFTGIVTRREVMKSVNYLVHNFEDIYPNIVARDKKTN